MSLLSFSATADVLLLYPRDSLKDQIGIWAGRHADRLVEASFERSLPEIRRLLRRAESVIVDATEDSARAAEAFLQAVARLGSGSVAVYTDAQDEGLELFVRVRGSLFVLGPFFEGQWEEFFEGWRHGQRVPLVCGGARQRTPASPDRRGWPSVRSMNRALAPFDRTGGEFA